MLQDPYKQQAAVELITKILMTSDTSQERLKAVNQAASDLKTLFPNAITATGIAPTLLPKCIGVDSILTTLQQNTIGTLSTPTEANPHEQNFTVEIISQTEAIIDTAFSNGLKSVMGSVANMHHGVLHSVLTKYNLQQELQEPDITNKWTNQLNSNEALRIEVQQTLKSYYQTLWQEMQEIIKKPSQAYFKEFLNRAKNHIKLLNQGIIDPIQQARRIQRLAEIPEEEFTKSIDQTTMCRVVKLQFGEINKIVTVFNSIKESL